MWYSLSEKYLEIAVFVKPNAKKTALIGVKNDELHISLHAKPHEGEANQELILFLAKLFKVPKSQIDFIRGDSSRHKRLRMPVNDDVRQVVAGLSS